MKLLCTLLASTLVASVAAGAQSATQSDGKSLIGASAGQQPLPTLRRDLVTAISSMLSGLGIYSGHRDASINAAHQAQSIVESLIAAANPPAPAKATSADSTSPAKSQTKDDGQKKPGDTKAAAGAKTTGSGSTASTKDKAKDEAQKKPADTKTPTGAKPATTQTKDKPVQTVAGSQAAMRKGLEAIQQAIKDLKAAASSIPEAKAAQLAKLLQTAADEATKSISLHADQG